MPPKDDSLVAPRVHRYLNRSSALSRFLQHIRPSNPKRDGVVMLGVWLLAGLRSCDDLMLRPVACLRWRSHCEYYRRPRRLPFSGLHTTVLNASQKQTLYMEDERSLHNFLAVIMVYGRAKEKRKRIEKKKFHLVPAATNEIPPLGPAHESSSFW